MLTSIENYEIYNSEIQNLGIDISGKIIPYFDVQEKTGQTPLRGEDYCYLREMYEEIYRSVYGETSKHFFSSYWWKKIDQRCFSLYLRDYIIHLFDSGYVVDDDYEFGEVERYRFSSGSSGFLEIYPEAKKGFDNKLETWDKYSYNRKKDFVRAAFYELASIKRFYILSKALSLSHSSESDSICIDGSYGFAADVPTGYDDRGKITYDERSGSRNVSFDAADIASDINVDLGVLWEGDSHRWLNPYRGVSDTPNNPPRYFGGKYPRLYKFTSNAAGGCAEIIFGGNIYAGYKEVSTYKDCIAIVRLDIDIKDASNTGTHSLYIPFACEKVRTGIGSYAEAFRINGFTPSAEWYKSLIVRFFPGAQFVRRPATNSEQETFNVYISSIWLVGSCDFRSEIDSLNWKWTPTV